MGEPATIAIGQALDRRVAAQLMQDLDRHFRSRPTRLTFDLRAVTAFASAGLGCVVEGMRRARELGVEVRLRGLSQPMLDFFSLVSVERLAAPLVPTGGVLRQHVSVQDASAVFSDLWLPCEDGRIELTGSLDLEAGAYDLDVTAQGPGGARQELRLEGSRDALVPSQPVVPVPPPPPEPRPGG